MGFFELLFKIGLEMPFSCVVLALLANIGLLVRIHFDDRVINKLTERHYYAALVALILMTLDLGALIYTSEIIYEGDTKRLYKEYNEKGSTVNIVFVTFFILKVTSALLFIIERSHEEFSLWVFSNF